MGLAGCEELLLGRVDFARPRPLFMFFFQIFSLAPHDVVEGFEVRLYHSSFFGLRRGREERDGVGEGDVSVFI